VVPSLSNMNITQPAQGAPVIRIEDPRLLSFAKSLLSRRSKDRDALLPLYQAVVAVGRDPFWYREGQVPDTVDGRFNMVAAVTAILLVRMEEMEGDEAKRASVLLTETFIDDMDESLRQIGIGDYVVGKHIGRMMGALGGRLAAFRQAAEDRDYLTPVRRNIYHEAPPSEQVALRVAERLDAFETRLRDLDLDELIEGKLPKP
jgi:cytochrome b pre-mRNA-processing protein 3